MGAVSFYHTIVAKSPRDAFEALTAEALHERGHDAYNGTISTCSMGRCKLSFNKFAESNVKKADQLIEKLNRGEKWVADYIDLGVVGYKKTTVKKIVKQYDAKYKQQFCVINDDTGRLVNSRAHYDKKGDADNAAIEYILKGMDVSVKKDMLKLSGNNTVTEFKVETKTVSKPKKMDSTISEYHKYIFFGWAAC